MATPSPYVFISYASVDRERVLPVVDALEGAGIRTWLDQAAIPGGTVYGPEIVAGIANCAAFVILCSGRALTSPNVRQEIALAWKYQRPYLPLLLEPVSIPREVEYWLEGAQWIEVHDQPTDVWLRAVLQAVARLAPDVVAPTTAEAPAPVEATDVPEQPDTSSGDAVVIPAAPAAPQQLPLVGRETELAVLQALLEFAAAGRGQVAFLVGEPGIGKTRLASALIEQAQAAGWQTRWSYCIEWEGAPPYWPWIELLRATLADLDATSLRAVLGTGGADLAQILPELRLRLPDLPVLLAMEPEQARFRLFECVTGTLRSLAQRQRLLLVLDDLHWADAASVALLQFVTKGLQSTPILILATYRSVEVSQQRPLAATLASLLREPHATRLLLRGLTETDAGQYVRALAGADPSAAMLAAIYRETEGNPFFVGEITRLLLDEGTLWQRDTAALRIRVPESVREVVGRRLERLSDACRHVLRVASVVGHEFSLGTLDALHGQGTDALLDVLDEAIATQLVEEEASFGRYRFSHALVQETLYDELSTARRAQLHARIGNALEETYANDRSAHLDELAHHFFQGARAGSVDKAIDYARRAGERASTHVAWEAAVVQYHRALQVLELVHPPNESVRCELFLALGAAQWHSGDTNAGRASYRQAGTIARVTGSVEHLARAALGESGGDVPGQAFDDDELHDRVEAAIDQLPEADSVLRAKLLAQLAAMVPDVIQARALADDADAMARRLGDMPTLLHVLIRRWHAVTSLDIATLHEQHVIADELIRLAERAGDRQMTLLGHAGRAVTYLDLGDIPAFDRDFAVWEALAAELRMPIWIGSVLTYQAMRALMDGRFSQVEPLVTRWVEVGGPTIPASRVEEPTQHRFSLYREQRRLDELEATVRELVREIEHGTRGVSRVEGQSVRVYWRCRDALLELELGRPGGAKERFERLAVHDFDDVPRNHWWLTNIAFLAELSYLIDDRDRATRLYELLRPHADRHISIGAMRRCYGSASYYLGLLATTLGDWSAAEQHFADALAIHRRMGTRPYAAHTQLAWAEMLVRRGDPADLVRALALADQSLRAAEEIGMTRLAEQAYALKGQPGGSAVTPVQD